MHLSRCSRQAFDSLKQVLDNEKDAHRQFVDESAERMKRLEKRYGDVLCTDSRHVQVTMRHT